MRNNLLLIFLLILGSYTYSQGTVNSIYSSSGLGEIGGGDHPVAIGIGNNTITMVDSTVLNFYNPASYNLLAKGQPLFSFATSTRLSNYKEGGNSSFASSTSIQHFALGFKIKKNFGLAMGLKPYSRRGYEFVTGENLGADSITYLYTGGGSINEAFLGFSAALISRENTIISIGANAGFLYGEIYSLRASSLYVPFAEIKSGGVDAKGLRMKTFHYTVGFHALHHFTSRSQLAISAVFDPTQKLNAEYAEGLFYAPSITNPNSYDTLTYTRVSGSITSAASATFGLNYVISMPSSEEFGRSLNSEVSFHASYNSTNWGSYQTSFNVPQEDFLTTYKVNFGIQYIPETKFIENSSTTKFHQRIRYRAGAYQYSLPYLADGNQVTDAGLTLGFGLPIIIQKSLSSINFGFSIGKRGVSNPLYLKENYYGINFGITIAPSSADRWFRKNKLN